MKTNVLCLAGLLGAAGISHSAVTLGEALFENVSDTFFFQSYTVGSGFLPAMGFSPSRNGDATGIEVFLSGPALPYSVRLHENTGSGPGSPGAILGQLSSVSAGAGNFLEGEDFTAPISLEAGTLYWISIFVEDNGVGQTLAWRRNTLTDPAPSSTLISGEWSSTDAFGNQGMFRVIEAVPEPSTTLLILSFSMVALRRKR